MIILGSTGSIGKNTLKLAEKFNLSVNALACAKNYKLLNKQIAKFKPKLVFIKDESLAHKVEHKSVFSGDIKNFLLACDGEISKENLLINAFVGFSGLIPSKIAQTLGFKLALANKESLVAGGAFLDTDKIFPIDSEHFGLKFLLQNNLVPPKKLILTASGGAVAKMKNHKKIANLKLENALKHPNWNMGAKITIDSATMANKLFEVLEAFWLYKIKNIDAIIEQTSKIHALVEFKDGSTTAHISTPDMRLAIAGALGLKTKILNNMDLVGAKISFKEINLKKYAIFALKNFVLQNPKIGVIINAANDEMVQKFLNKKCNFGDISKNVLKACDKFASVKISSFEEVLDMDRQTRRFINNE